MRYKWVSQSAVSCLWPKYGDDVSRLWTFLFTDGRDKQTSDDTYKVLNTSKADASVVREVTHSRPRDAVSRPIVVSKLPVGARLDVLLGAKSPINVTGYVSVVIGNSVKLRSHRMRFVALRCRKTMQRTASHRIWCE